MLNTKEWITIRTFNYSHEAYTVKSFLDSYGFQSMLKDELTINADPLLSNSIGGVKLQVLYKDYKEIEQILIENDYIKVSNKFDLHLKIENLISNNYRMFLEIFGVLVIIFIITFFYVRNYESKKLLNTKIDNSKTIDSLLKVLLNSSSDSSSSNDPFSNFATIDTFKKKK